MQNKLSDLNNHLFAAIERLNDEELSSEQLDIEIKRSEAIQKIGKTIIENGALALRAKQYVDEYASGESVDIPFLGISKE